MAERQGFEPWEGYKPSTVFKTAAFDHSATSPEAAHNTETFGELLPLADKLSEFFLRNKVLRSVVLKLLLMTLTFSNVSGVLTGYS